MSRKSISALPPFPLDKRDTQSNRIALSDIPRRLSAGVAWLVGYLRGGDELEAGQTPNLAPRSPMHGLRGHTHTGGLDGRAIFRDVYTTSLDPSDQVASNLTSNGNLSVVGFDSQPASTTVKAPMGPTLLVWVPGCDVLEGCFVDMAWRLQVFAKVSTNFQAGDVLTIELKNQTTGDVVSGTIDATSGTGYFPVHNTDGTAAQLLRFAPGVINNLTVSAEFVTDATVASRTLSVEIFEAQFGVYES